MPSYALSQTLWLFQEICWSGKKNGIEFVHIDYINKLLGDFQASGIGWM